MSHTINESYLQAAYGMALEYGFSEEESEKFAQEMLEEAVASNAWASVLNEARGWAEDAEKSKWQDYEREVL